MGPQVGHSHRSEPCSSHTPFYPDSRAFGNSRTGSVMSTVGKETSSLDSASATGPQTRGPSRAAGPRMPALLPSVCLLGAGGGQEAEGCVRGGDWSAVGWLHLQGDGGMRGGVAGGRREAHPDCEPRSPEARAALAIHLPGLTTAGTEHAQIVLKGPERQTWPAGW